jgi:hypothetical protein
MSPTFGSLIGGSLGALGGLFAGKALSDPESDEKYRSGKGVSARYAAESAGMTGFLSVVGALIGGAIGASLTTPSAPALPPANTPPGSSP